MKKIIITAIVLATIYTAGVLIILHIKLNNLNESIASLQSGVTELENGITKLNQRLKD